MKANRYTKCINNSKKKAKQKNKQSISKLEKQQNK
jgi:hypothetical protein